MSVKASKYPVAPLLCPRSIVVVGASHDPAKLGHVLLKNVLEGGFKGTVYPVNPAGGHILGRPVFRFVRELPEAPDLVLVSIPSRGVPEVIREAAAVRARTAVILSSAFAEMGGDGAGLQSAILKTCRASSLRILGPNCMGVYNAAAKLNGTYFWKVPSAPGNIAFLSQSGAYGGILFSHIRQRHCGVNKFVSVGNQSDLVLADFCEYLADDPETQVAALFIEEVKEPRRFLTACARLAAKKPVVVFKVGRTEAGRRAALSHTGSLAGDWEVFAQAVRQAGGFLARDTDEFIDAVCMFSAYPRTVLRPRAVAVATISGGPSVAAGDACEGMGIPVPELENSIQRKIRKKIPEFGASRNPVDMTPQMNPGHFSDAVSILAQSRRIGGIVAVNVGLDKPEFADAFLRVRPRKPVTAFLIDNPMISRRFADGSIPEFPSPERAGRALSFLVQRESLRTEASGFKGHSGNAGQTGAVGALSESEARKLLKGIPFCRETFAPTEDAARKAAARIGFPLAVKVFGAGPHKSDRGGVVLNVCDTRVLDAALARLKKRISRPGGYLIQEFVKGEMELIFGARVDPQFGPYVLFGLGGIFTELTRQFVIRLCPVTPLQARKTIETSPFAAILAGARGLPPVNMRTASDILVRLSRIITTKPNIMEIDINPVVVRAGKLVAVDSMIAVA